MKNGIPLPRYPTAARCSLEISNGFKDWYLPTSKEMEIIYNNRNILDKSFNKTFGKDTGIIRGKYWCSDLNMILETHARFFDLANGQKDLEWRSAKLEFMSVRRF